MHNETKEILKHSIINCLNILRPLADQEWQDRMVWKKDDTGQWHGRTELQPDYSSAYRIARPRIAEFEAMFHASLLKHHPDHCGMIGFRGTAWNWAKPRVPIVSNVIQSLSSRHRGFDVSDADVDQIVQEFSDFVDSTDHTFKFQALLINFKMNADVFQLHPAIVIRRLTEEEVSLYNPMGNSHFGGFNWSCYGINEFVIEGDLIEPKLLGDNHKEGQVMSQRAKELLDKAMLCLRAYKPGSIGYESINFHSATMCPLSIPSVRYNQNPIPFGNYSLVDVEFTELEHYAQMVFDCGEKSMQLALSRLADAEIRTRPEDMIIDAAIGMEALLLASLGKDDRRSELSFRFALNYSTLFETPDEKLRGFQIARDIYSLRSLIAHGSISDQKVYKIGHENMSLDSAAQTTKATLRAVIQYFLPLSGYPYRQPEFWKRRYVGFSD